MSMPYNKRPVGVTVTKAVGYVRVSTAEQSESGLGIAAQRLAIYDEVRRRGWQLVDVFDDAGQSGRSLRGRTGLKAAIDTLNDGEADALVVAKVDRLSRSLIDFAYIMELGRKRGWSVLALDLGVDTTTPSGEMMANVMATFAQFERRLISQRTAEALAVKKANGVKLGRPRSVPEELRSRILQLLDDGLPLRRIASILTEEGVPTSRGGVRWHTSTVRAVVEQEKAESGRRIAS